MMVRIADSESRRKNVLLAIIESFIDNPSPISSEFIAKEFDFSLSSASIRNVMAGLEEDGFITHPHTSAGRTPTDKGYRFYVDNLMGKSGLEDVQKQAINQELHSYGLEIEELLENVSGVLARFLHYPSIVSFSQEDRVYSNGASFIFEQPEFNDIKKLHSIFKLLDEKHNLLKTMNQDIGEPLKVYIGQENSIPEIKNCTLILATYKKKNKPQGRVAVLGPTRLRYSYAIPLVEYTSNILSDFLDEI